MVIHFKRMLMRHYILLSYSLALVHDYFTTQNDTIKNSVFTSALLLDFRFFL